MIRCSQPGCSGSVVDGWCDVCGSPGPRSATDAAQSAPDAAQPPAGAAPTSAGPTSGGPRPCAQPGCQGTLVDGWCDVCGSPAPGPATSAPVTPAQGPATAAPSAAGAPAPSSSPSAARRAHTGAPGPTASAPSAATPLDTGGVGSTVTRGSSRLDSIQLGSARARTSGSQATRRTTGSARLRHARIGAGLTRVPPAPVVDAAAAVMVDPSVPERRRNCPSCGAPVGRSREGRPGRAEGFCPQCRSPYSFTPKLVAGDLVAGQYQVAGCLAHGGMGWIYLARDKNVSDRWVVLKGLLNSGDADALAAAISESQFLAQVEHPLIVEIYNFVTHEGAGYIVMEYVGGRSLKDLLKERMRTAGGVYDPLPPDQAIAYVLEVLPAFQYLHDMGLVYCDFKPDNVVQVGDALKLIDLGGVRRVDDQDSAIFGTIGYQAPEVASQGTTVASDIYTVGRTLMVLGAEFRGYQTTYQFSLPPVAETELFQEHDSLFRLLSRCCAPDPADRFASADELRVQLLGLLREEVAARTTGTALTSAASVLFESPAASADTLGWADLPQLRADSTDPQHTWLQSTSVPDPRERLTVLERDAPGRSAEVLLALCRCALEIGDRALLQSYVGELLAVDPWEWRAVWMAGLGAIQSGDHAAASASFNAVYGQVPGELAPKLALALACEQGSDSDLAESLYRRCASTDANYVSPAAFGLARIRARAGDLAGSLEALDLVPATSRGYADSRRLRAQHLIVLGGSMEDYAEALRSIEAARLGDAERDRLTVDILDAALLARQRRPDLPPTTLGAWRSTEDGLRDGLESTYRRMARRTSDRDERTRLVDTANHVRKWSRT
ncbi:serine/threonine-protein kinase [Auraticoccus monumenti]|uniref:non-specific serine/threonine protein kinase n=1 Tax=Auraticoccus monumenti TaxID=675864 RepID=A0A1G7AI24_9ACTN|nr:serine/threonine-protein kinase [Auraticoccus monumenti]SDE14588.1 serine/threonine-protein kinase PknG [Auraticoccus monumenti]